MPATPPDGHLDMYCPRCQSYGALLFRALRSSAVYVCRDCDHEWEVPGGLGAK